MPSRSAARGWQLLLRYAPCLARGSFTNWPNASHPTGLDLTPIFNQYLRHADVPVLELKVDATRGSVEYRWQASENAFAMPIKVGKPEAWQIITPTGQWQTLQTSLSHGEFEVATDLYYVTVSERPTTNARAPLAPPVLRCSGATRRGECVQPSY